MPLKHLTETVLIVLLGLTTIATGVIVSTLPHIPEGFFPWAIVVVATVLYPAVLYPLLKNNRADYAFRALHFAPVGIALLWMMIEVAMLKEPRLVPLHGIYTWGWTAAAVALTFLLLAAFCLQVIRRRVPRIAFLLFLFTPFLVSAFMAENFAEWKTQLAALLWEEGVSGPVAALPGGSRSSPLSASSRGEKNLRSSSVPAEEEWRKKLRAVEQGSAHSVSIAGPLKGVKATSRLSSPETTGKTLAGKSKSKLPKSGGETEALAVFFVAAAIASAHNKARRRV